MLIISYERKIIYISVMNDKFNLFDKNIINCTQNI